MKLTKYISIIILLCAFLSAHKAQAAKLEVKAGDFNTTVDQKLIDSWSGKFTATKKTLLTDSSTSVNDIIGNHLGLIKAQTQNLKNQNYNFDPGKIYSWLETQRENIDQEPQEPKISIQNNRVTDFTPPTEGLRLDSFKSTFSMISALESKNESVNLDLQITSPKTSLGSLNNLGIKELISRGESSFKGSPKNRRINIGVGVKNLTGVLIKPGEEFSFNKYLGPVEKEFGFVPELVIKADGTKPELGGGLCQVSSTTFRAAMAAGLPITQRKNHSYAVQYYAPQGTDATIYPGVIDLKFINDTPATILVWPYLKDENTLRFDFYGTKDSRQVTLEKPTQYDRKSDGSMKATWIRTVTNNGKERTDTFKSVYLPPALFHKEEKFVTADPANPTPTPPSTENQTNSPVEQTTTPAPNNPPASL